MSPRPKCHVLCGLLTFSLSRMISIGGEERFLNTSCLVLKNKNVFWLLQRNRHGRQEMVETGRRMVGALKVGSDENIFRSSLSCLRLH